MSAVQELQGVMDRYLAFYEAHDAAACAASYAEDAVLLSPFGPPRVGRAAIQAEHEAWFTESETNKVMSVLEASIKDDIGYCLVSYAADVPSETGTLRVYGASLNTLGKDTSGEWLLKHTSLNELEHDLTQDLK